MKSVLAIMAAGSICLTSGCASIVSGTNQPLTVDAPDCAGAMCRLTNSKGTWAVKTPGSVVVHRAYGPLTVVCAKEGYPSTTTQVDSKTKGMAYGNILFGGIIGAGVDTSTGAAYDYPVLITVPMNCGVDVKRVSAGASHAVDIAVVPNGQAAEGSSGSAAEISVAQEVKLQKVELASVSMANSYSGSTVKKSGHFTGKFEGLPPSATGAKRLSCEYSFTNAKNEWHMVYGNCPSEWAQ